MENYNCTEKESIFNIVMQKMGILNVLVWFKKRKKHTQSKLFNFSLDIYILGPKVKLSFSKVNDKSASYFDDKFILINKVTLTISWGQTDR